MEEKKDNKKVKNYIILIVLFLVTTLLTLYLCQLYKVYDEYKKQTPIIRDTLFEVTSQDLKHYMLENPSSILYMCTSNDDVCREYEKQFKKLVISKNLQNSMVYLNLTNIDQDKFVNDFNKAYPFRTKLTTAYPAIVIFEDGEVINMLQGKVNDPLTVVETKQFIELHEIGE